MKKGVKKTLISVSFKGISVFGFLDAAGMETKPENLRNFAHNGKCVGIGLLDDTLYHRDLAFAYDANQNGAVFFRVHTFCRSGGYAAAKLFHQREAHFLGFGGDDTEFNRRVETVGNRLVRFAFDIRFKRRQKDGKKGCA